MEHYIEIIILLAPGFIAKEVARVLGNIKSKASPIDQALSYFVYSLFACIGVLVVYWLVDTSVENKIALDIILAVTAVVSGVITGALWQLLIKGQWRKVIRAVTICRDGYEYFQEDSLLNANIMDGKDHFIEVRKNNKRIAVGFFLGGSFATDKAFELKINNHPYYAGWLDSKYKSLFPYRDTYFDFTHDIEIIEYGYPEELLDGSLNEEIATSLLEKASL